MASGRQQAAQPADREIELGRRGAARVAKHGAFQLRRAQGFGERRQLLRPLGRRAPRPLGQDDLEPIDRARQTIRGALDRRRAPRGFNHSIPVPLLVSSAIIHQNSGVCKRRLRDA